MRAHSAAIVLAAAVAACRTPTQIDVTVSTDLPCPRVTGTAFTSGTLGALESLPATATTHSCANTHIGSVVLVPSGADDSALVGFKVITAINGESVDDCVPGDAGTYGPNCIVARRALRYLPHTQLTVDVRMSGACAGIACDDLSTCVEGSCAPATIGNPSQCTGNGCDEGVLGAGDAGTHDASVLDAEGPDATLRDAAADAPTPVVPPCDMAGLLADAAWPMEGYCPYGRARSPLVGPHVQPALLWSVPLAGGGASAPSIGPDGTVYVATLGGVVEALQPSDGGAVWTDMPFGDAAAIWSMPVLAADETVRIFDFTMPGAYAVLSLDGGVQRTVPVAPVRGGVTLVGGGTMFAADTFGSLDALNAKGAVLYSVPQVAEDGTRPSVAPDGTVFSNDNRGAIYAIVDGGAAWQASFDAGIGGTSTPRIAIDGTLRVLSYQDALYALDPGSGAVLWGVQVLPGAGDLRGMALAEDGTTYLGSSAGLFAYDLKGNLIGKSANLAVGAPTVDAQGYVYAQLGDNQVAGFDPGCNLKWQVTLPSVPGGGAVSDSPVIGPGEMVYVTFDSGGNAGVLAAIGPAPP
jgi:outer membrane protein assembly factor BamB